MLECAFKRRCAEQVHDTEMNEREFWLSVRRRRRLFFLWWIGWLPFGLIGIISLTALIHGADFIVGVTVLSAWFIVWLYIARSIRKLACPKCGKSAIRHPYFFMRHVACQHCGLRPAESPGRATVDGE